MTICFHYLVNKKVLVLRLREQFLCYYQEKEKASATLSRPLALDSMRQERHTFQLSLSFWLRCKKILQFQTYRVSQQILAKIPNLMVNLTEVCNVE